MKLYRAGNIKNCYEQWSSITSDTNILNIIHEGLELDFLTIPPSKGPYQYGRNKEESVIIDEEIKNYSKKE